MTVVELAALVPLPGVISRRLFVSLLAGSTVSLMPLARFRAIAESPADVIQSALKDFSNSGELSAANFGFREFEENFPLLSLERAPSRIKPSKLKISKTARDLIIAFEVSSEAIYSANYRRPIWPGGRSGATIGIGYDLGYVSTDELTESWERILNGHAEYLSILKIACGVTGDAAKDLVPKLSDVEITWAVATEQFNVEIQRYVTLTQTSLPNFSALSEDCRGALVSLVYNRGPSFDVPKTSDPSGRYQEMRNIRQLMVERKLEDIPNEIRSMRRLWPDVRGLKRRREAEAALFEQGL
ncbi:hypothetical protein [Rhizobium ruizarguesonis]|uniref:hypothetical protein n=1 Tax=Rhizobium ruizarguesonis TaxID=2081791 RepID=UPI00144771D0|nr:hypothetical protein [Rhizobium ruizarguesonis]NKQ85525.1 hypothetical protein [Rhizobium ruizarguesonis]